MRRRRSERGCRVATVMRLLVGATALVASACGPGPIVRHGVLNAPVLAGVERGLERVRGLRFTSEVPGRVLDDDRVRRFLEDELARQFKPGDLEHLSAVYARLGLLPPATSLRPVLQELYEDQLAAFYDPRTKALALTANGLRQRQPLSVRVLGFLAGRDLLGEFIVAHELTHALQDQHFGLPTTTPPLTDGRGDADLARHALLEGDASLAALAYLRAGPLDRETVLKFTEQVAGIPEELAARHPNVPDIIRTGLAFEYNTGSLFAAAAYLRGGWAAVDRAHRDPPASTEQVIHPERYFDARDRPVEITVGGTESLERHGWTRVLEDTLGELDVRVLAARVFGPQHAAAIAGGWGGDRLRAFARGDGIAVVWLTAWDTERDAEEFADALPALVADAGIERRGARVLVALVADARALAPRIWTQSRFAPGA